MAILNSSDRLTAIEQVKRSGVSSDARRIIEELTLTNTMLLDAPIVEANGGVEHTHLVRTAIPHATHRGYNEGVGSGASQTKTIHDVMCQLAIYSKVDVDLVKKSAHPQELLMTENAAFIQGMGQDQAKDIFYGNHDADPRCMDGFAKRRSVIDNVTTFDAGGTGDNLTSIYLVKWGQQFCKMIYPRGSNGLGVNRTDKGIQTVQDANGREYEAYVNYYTCDYGMTVGHEKSLIRIANVDIKSAKAEDIIKDIIRLKSKLATGDGTVSILCNSDVMSMIDIATLDRSNVVYTATDPWGREVNKIRDMRIRQCDALDRAESQLTK